MLRVGGARRPGPGPTIALAAARFAGRGRSRAVMVGIRAVGRDEVDHRLRVLHVLAEVGPARVRRKLAVAGRRRGSGGAPRSAAGRPPRGHGSC